MSFHESQLRPADDYYIVRRDKDARKTAGGIHLPQNLEQRKQNAVHGEVIACGPGHMKDSGERAPMDYGVGATVVFNPYAGSEFELEVGGDKLTLLSQRNIICEVVPYGG